MRRIDSDLARDLAIAAGIGVVGGLRSMTAPAAVALAMNRGRLRVPKGKFEFLESNKALLVIGSMALGELIVDKLPGVPNRTSPPALTTRIITGGFAGAAISASRRRPVLAGVLLGGFGAIAGSFLGFYARKQITQSLHTNDAAVAIVEDAVAIGAGLLLAA